MADRTTILVFAIAMLLSSGLLGIAAAQPGPTVVSDDVELEVDETATLTLSLDAAPDGLSEFWIIMGENTTVAFEAVHAGDIPLNVSEHDPDRASILAEDVDGVVDPGSEDVELVTLEVQGITAGTNELRIDVMAMDDDAGDPIDPSVDPGTITVIEGDEAGDDDETADADDTADGDELPGFGPLVTIMALLGSAVLIRGWRA